MREMVIEWALREKLVAIVRGVESEKCLIHHLPGYVYCQHPDVHLRLCRHPSVQPGSEGAQADPDPRHLRSVYHRLLRHEEQPV